MIVSTGDICMFIEEAGLDVFAATRLQINASSQKW